MQLNQSTIIELVSKLVNIFKAKSLMLVTAESCTGGWVAQAITSISGSGDIFDRGFITYNNEAKQEVLGVSNEILKQLGAVSEEVARQMAGGALKNSHADVAIAVTGNAGPTSSEGKPVGLVCFAWAFKNKETVAATKQFDGDREAVRQQSVEFTLAELLKLLLTN